MHPSARARSHRPHRVLFTALLCLAALAALGLAAPAGGRGPHADDAWAADRDLFHALLDHRDAIARTVTPLENGVSTLTETDDPELRARLREHVTSMRDRIRDGRGIHLRDPLFAEVFRNADRIEMRVEDTERGVRVTETSDDPAVAELLRAHAAVVDGFLANGYAEVHRDHAVPGHPEAGLQAGAGRGCGGGGCCAGAKPECGGRAGGGCRPSRPCGSI